MRFTYLIVASALVLSLMATPVQAANAKVFNTPEAAMEAFGAALTPYDDKALRDLLGQDFRKLIPSVSEESYQRFLAAWEKSHTIVRGKDNSELVAHIAVGDDGWTLPLPLVQNAAGWSFDMRLAADEIRARIIGRNELTTMKAILAFYDAQKEYAEKSQRGDGILEYAQKFISTPGKRDGLYWKTGTHDEPSPIGDSVAQLITKELNKGAGYHGYRYRILTSQGAAAPGGAADYIVKGRMIGGFALIAWPVKYGETGVMSFIVNHDGIVYEHNMGPQTERLARQIRSYNPDEQWTKLGDRL